MKRGLVIRLVVAVFAAVALAAFAIDWTALTAPGDVRSTIDAELDGDPTQLKARVAGNLVQAPARDYHLVRAGDLLYQIDDRDFRARVDRARAEVAQAQAQIAQTGAQIAQQGAQVDVAQANLDKSRAQYALSSREQARQASFLHTESFLARDWQGAVADTREQSANVEGSQRTLRSESLQLDVLRAQLAGRRASLAAQQAVLALDEVQLGYTRITAPFDAVTTERLVRLGEYVAPGTALITLVPLHGAWAIANFREVQLARMRPGQPARVTVDAIPGVVFAGHVDSIQPGSQAQGSATPPDRATGSFTKIVQRIPVKIVLDPRPDFDASLLPGLSAEVQVAVSGTLP